MASLWQKTLFYLGLVDDEQVEAADETAQAQNQSQVRTVEPPRRSLISRPEGDRSGGASRPSGVVAGRRVEPPARTRRRISGNPTHAEAGVYMSEGAVTEPQPETETSVIVARSFSDAQQIADFIRDSQPVVLDLRGTEPAMVRRLVDFSTGLTYALDGRMAKIGQGVILVSPSGTVIGVEEQQRLADMGLYQAPISS